MQSEHIIDMATPTLYLVYASPPVRAVLMTAKALNVKFDEKVISLFRGDNLKPEYLQHTVPTLVDGDFTIWDSHAIMAYLVTKFGKNDELYPKELKKRTSVNQLLFFHSSVIFFHLSSMAKTLFNNEKPENFELLKNEVVKAYLFLENNLIGKKFMAGNTVTIADYSLIATVSTVAIVVPVDPKKFSSLAAWCKRCETIPEYDINIRGLAETAKRFKLFWTSN